MDIFGEILKALEAEDRVMLATIISTRGSTPASALSKMLVTAGGIVSVGTVGGGCMEGDVLLHAHRLYESGKAEILTFHLNEDDIEQGLICGGTLDVLIEPITKQDSDLFQEIRSIRDQGDDAVLVTVLGRNGVIMHKGVVTTRLEETRPYNRGTLSGQWNGSRQGEEIIRELIRIEDPSVPNAQVEPKGSGWQESLHELISKTHRRNETYRFQLADSEVLLEPITGCPSLTIFGGGHVSKYVSRAAAMAGFRVTVVDDRPKFANAERFPEAVQTMAVDFLEAFGQLDVKSSTYIVIVTRGHRHDEEVLERALQTPAKYIGMIGSHRKVLKTYEHLLERGVSTDTLRRVHAPIGIGIGAVTPEEIGVSIVAELIRVRRGEPGTLQHKTDSLRSRLDTLENKSINS